MLGVCVHSALGGHREIELAGATVGELLDQLAAAFPSLDGLLFDHGHVQPFATSTARRAVELELSRVVSRTGPQRAWLSQRRPVSKTVIRR
jgi:hypothetical protein